MSCPLPCPPDKFSVLKELKNDDKPVFLIRNESGNLVYPSINLYEDFISTCKQNKIFQQESKLNSQMISDNLESIFKKMEKDHPDEAFLLGQLYFEKVCISQYLSKLNLGGLF